MHIAATITQCLSRSQPTTLLAPSSTRFFSATSTQQNYLAPKAGESRKSRKGRCRVPTGGSMRGTTVVWGDYGLRMRDHDRRISAQQLKIAEDTIRKRLRGMKFIMYMRIAANIGVYTSGNDVRMGKGKGSFDRWTARVAVSKIIFEIQGDLHEQVVRDAFRLAGAKLPGMFSCSFEASWPGGRCERLCANRVQDCTSSSRRATPPSWA
jgi:ribosomal protein L16